MTPEQFAYWLQGFAEIGNNGPTPEQWKIIQDHLQTVFVKITPQYNPMPNLFPMSPQTPYPRLNKATEIYC